METIFQMPLERSTDRRTLAAGPYSKQPKAARQTHIQELLNSYVPYPVVTQ